MAFRVFGRFRALMAPARGPSSSSSLSSSSASAAAGAASGKQKVGGSTPGLLRPVPVSPAMKKFLGLPEISRSEAVKKVWDYIKLHRLQNPENKREIYCDERLKTIFDGKDKVEMLEIARLINLHFIKTQK